MLGGGNEGVSGQGGQEAEQERGGSCWEQLVLRSFPHSLSFTLLVKLHWFREC